MATLLWPLMECFPGKTEQQLKQKGPLLKGHQEFSSVRGVVLSLQGCSDVFSMPGGIRNITQATIPGIKVGTGVYSQKRD